MDGGQWVLVGGVHQGEVQAGEGASTPHFQAHHRQDLHPEQLARNTSTWTIPATIGVSLITGISSNLSLLWRAYCSSVVCYDLCLAVSERVVHALSSRSNMQIWSGK